LNKKELTDKDKGLAILPSPFLLNIPENIIKKVVETSR